MSIFEILNLIPPGLQQKIVDALIGFVAGQAKKLLGDQAAQKIESLKSDGAFKRAFREGLQRAADRFAHEYEAKDKDLVTAISSDAALFQDRQVQQALLAIVQNPAAYLADERERVVASFENVFPERKDRRRVDRAVTVFLKCLAEEVWTLPELQGVYSLLFQRITAEATRQQVELQKAQLQATAGLRVDVRQALLQLADAIAERKRLPSPGMPALFSFSKVYHNLPNPDYGTFVGRQEELKRVHRILRPYPHSQHAVVTKEESLEPESGNLVHTIRLALNRDYNADALDLFLSIVHSLNAWGLWDERLELAYKLCQAAQQSQDPVEVWLWTDAIGYISYQRQQFSECIQALNTGRTLARQYGLVDALLLADAFEARLYLGEGDAALATEKTESLLKQLDLDSILNCGTLRRIISRRIVSTAALVYRSTGAAARAKELYECALALRRSTDENPIPELSNLAHVSIQLNDLKSAKGYLAQVPVGAGKKDAAWNNYELAQISEREGETQKAIRLCELALKQFTQFGSKSGIRRCQQLLARLLPTQAQGDA